MLSPLIVSPTCEGSELQSAQVCGEPDSLLDRSAVESDQSSDSITPAILAKEQTLRDLFAKLGSVIVAYSGGVDSTYVAYVANLELGGRALCVTGESASLPQHLRVQLYNVVQEFGWKHNSIRTDELENPNYTANKSDRCFFCKDELYTKLETIAREKSIATIVDGATVDDLNDFRPGRQAASKHSVRSPLIEVGLSKAEIRLLSRKAGLPTWDKPASPCLSSRVAYGTTVTIERLTKIDRGESILRELGFREFRVRDHDTLVRLEIAPAELEKVLDKRVVAELASRFKALGFKYVTLDLHGFRSGSMNEVLPQAR